MVEQDAVDRIQKARSSAFPTAETSFSTPATTSSPIRTSQISLASCISDANQTVLSDPGLILVPISSITHELILSSAPNPPTRFPMLFTIRPAIDINRKPAQTVSALLRMRTRRSSLPWRALPSRAPHCETPGRKLRWMQRGNPIALGPTRPLRF